MDSTTREKWLENATEMLRAGVFKRNGEIVPAVKLSIGFTGSRGNKLAVLGACWHPAASADKVSQIFLTPICDDALEILGTLTHELIHAIYPAAGHGKVFKRCALKVGLAGKMRSTTTGPELLAELKAMLEILGPLPHAKLMPSKSGIKKQGTRMIKCTCSECGYVVRTVKTWLVAYGPPICPCNLESMNQE